MPNEHLLTALRAAIALLLILSLGGLTGAWMPSLGFLVVVLAGLHLLSAARGGRLDRQAAAAFWGRHGFVIGLAAIALAGLYFRLMDAGHGLWHVDTDIDERRLADSVLHFFRTGEVDHSTVEHYPGLHFWLLTGSFLLTFLYALMSGVARSLDAMPWEMFVWAGRATNAVVEAGAIVLTGLVGRAVSGRTAGLVAALVFAVSPVAVEISTQLRNEAGLTFFVVAAAYASVVALKRPTVTMGLVSGALGGFAMAIKYSGLFAWLPALVAAALAPRELRLRQLGLATAGFGLALAATNHFIWADFPNFVHQLSTEVAMTGANHWSAQANPGWFYAQVLADGSVGWPLLVAAACVCAWGLATANRHAWILLAFPLPYVWFMTKQPAQFSRWVYPLTPFVALAGVVGILYLAGMVRRQITGPERPAYIGLRSRRGQLATIVVILIGILPPIWLGARQFSRRLVDPTYVRAEAWLAATTAPDDRILSEHREHRRGGGAQARDRAEVHGTPARHRRARVAGRGAVGTQRLLDVRRGRRRTDRPRRGGAGGAPGRARRRHASVLPRHARTARVPRPRPVRGRALPRRGAHRSSGPLPAEWSGAHRCADRSGVRGGGRSDGC